MNPSTAVIIRGLQNGNKQNKQNVKIHVWIDVQCMIYLRRSARKQTNKKMSHQKKVTVWVVFFPTAHQKNLTLTATVNQSHVDRQQTKGPPYFLYDNKNNSNRKKQTNKQGFCSQMLAVELLNCTLTFSLFHLKKTVVNLFLLQTSYQQKPELLNSFLCFSLKILDGLMVMYFWVKRRNAVTEPQSQECCTNTLCNLTVQGCERYLAWLK